jgi:hypothetical protein
VLDVRACNTQGDDTVQTVSGQIERFIEGAGGAVHGFVLDDGQVVRFSAEKAAGVSWIVCVGSHVGIEGVLHSDEGYWEPFLIMNFDSKRSVKFLAPHSQARPGMLPHSHPKPGASLVHPAISHSDSRTEGPVHNEILRGEKPGHFPAQPSSTFNAHRIVRSAQPPIINRDDAAASISKSYDALHRVQAILAYLHIMKRDVSGIGQLLDEAKHTYIQALSRYDSRSFVAASEFAAASTDLARVVEILISRTVRSDSSLPSLVPRPPDSFSQATDPADIKENLTEAESTLTRVHRLLEKGTLPLEDRAQVRKIASWSDAFYHQAQHCHDRASLADASELARAAVTAAYSAEHVCRKWYVGQTLVPPNEVSESLPSLSQDKNGA